MREVKDFYDNWSPDDFPEYIRLIMDFADELIFNELKGLLKNLRKDILVLDCGCGFGAFYDLTKDFNTIYLDISLNLLKRFELKERKICGNILHLPFKDNTFDLVLCINVLEHVDYLKALNEIKRVLKDNGHLIAVVVNRDSLIKEEIFNDFENVEISSFEIEKNRQVPTIESVEFLLKTYRKIYLVIGADHLNSLDKWNSYHDCVSLFLSYQYAQHNTYCE